MQKRVNNLNVHFMVIITNGKLESANETIDR